MFWNLVDQEIARYDLLKHPFYQAWSAGELTTQDLKFYAEQYYHHVSKFPTYLTSLHSRLPEGAMRRAVLANAYEEECEACPHSELWLRFVVKEWAETDRYRAEDANFRGQRSRRYISDSRTMRPSPLRSARYLLMNPRCPGLPPKSSTASSNITAPTIARAAILRCT